ncbi:MAG TPA: hypothetical protein VNE83_01985 [Terriglobales bacterium]|nr:hypothetical protein [Terriglobales bacterium]
MSGMVPLSLSAMHARLEHRANELSRTGKGGSDLENWLQAEDEIVLEVAGTGRNSTEPLQFPSAAKKASHR